MKRYGPYFHKSTGYFYYTDIYANGRRKMTYVHRDVVTRREKRRLSSDEIVHHGNENKIDNADDNLEITTPIEHGKMHVRSPEMVMLICALCEKEFVRLARWERANRKGRAGPFCSVSCASIRPMRHGTDGGYTYHKCRCKLCRYAHAEKARKRRRKSS